MKTEKLLHLNIKKLIIKEFMIVIIIDTYLCNKSTWILHNVIDRNAIRGVPLFCTFKFIRDTSIFVSRNNHDYWINVNISIRKFPKFDLHHVRNVRLMQLRKFRRMKEWGGNDQASFRCHTRVPRILDVSFLRARTPFQRLTCDSFC